MKCITADIFVIFHQKKSNFGFWVDGWVLAVNPKHFRDSAKLRALSAHVPKCPYMLTCPHANVLYLLTCSRANVLYVRMCSRSHVPTCLTCLPTHVKTCFAFLRAHVPTFFTCLRAHRLTCLGAYVSCALRG